MGRVDFCLFDVDYIIENGETVTRIWGKTKNGKTVLALDRKFRPYFYLELDDKHIENFNLSLFREKLSAIKDYGSTFIGAENVERKLLGEPRRFVKVFAKTPSDVSELKRVAEHWPEIKKPYEYDIPFYRRYIIDKGLVPMGWVSAEGVERAGEDENKNLEVIDAESVQAIDGIAHKMSALALDIEIYGDEIIMVSLAGHSFRKVLTYGWEGESNEHVEILDGEKRMLERLAEILLDKDPDFIITYNGDMFDFVKIKDRADKYKIQFRIGRNGKAMEFVKRGRTFSAFIPGRVHLDLYSFIEHILGDSLESETLTLDMVSKELLGEGKDALEWKDIEKLWEEKKNLKVVADYCLKDSELTLNLADRLLPQVFELSKLVGQTPFDVSRMTYSQLVEWLLIRSAHAKGEIALNRPDQSEIEKRREASPYVGGYVLLPEPGIHEDIALFDFASLYPTTIITHNISPETLDKNGDKGNAVPGSDHYFSLDKKGFIPEIIEGIVKKRMEIKKEMESLEPGTKKYKDLYNMQYALKIITNASYGYYAYAGSRWYSRICAMSIAAFGRYYIQKVISFAKEQGLDVIYGDTDSLFVAKCNEKRAEKFLKDVNDSLPGVMELDFDGMYVSGIFVPAKSGVTAKKRYALLSKDGKITIRGFEKVRRDWCKISKDTQEKVLFAILKDKDENKAVAIVRDAIERINKGDIDTKDLVIYTQITRPLETYEQIGPHVAAAKKYAAKGHSVKEGSIIGYIITRGDGSISSRAEPFEYAQNYDPDYYINNQILPAAMRILYGLGFSEDDVLGEGDESQRSLNTFMKKSMKRKLKDKFEKFKSD
jgi:DNA polymerase elongation subunit (family B)